VADRIVVPSPAVAEELEALHPHTRGKITVIPGGVDAEMAPLTVSELAAFRDEHGLPRRWLLHVGTFEPRKNHRFLIEIHTALCAEIDAPPPLIMAGEPGPTLHRVERWISRSPWADCIHVQTGVSDRDLRGFLSGAAALIFPSLSEGFGLPVLEALAVGAPVIAADTPGLDFFRDSPATLLPLGAVQPWISALRRVLTDPPAPEASRRWAADLTWERAAERQIAVWREMIGL
jgi:alpha-1,3-rhamnosyl/mannosyltransferase